MGRVATARHGTGPARDARRAGLQASFTMVSPLPVQGLAPVPRTALLYSVDRPPRSDGSNKCRVFDHRAQRVRSLWIDTNGSGSTGSYDSARCSSRGSAARSFRPPSRISILASRLPPGLRQSHRGADQR